MTVFIDSEGKRISKKKFYLDRRVSFSDPYEKICTVEKIGRDYFRIAYTLTGPPQKRETIRDLEAAKLFSPFSKEVLKRAINQLKTRSSKSEDKIAASKLEDKLVSLS